MITTLLHASELITGSGIRKKDGRRITEQDLETIEDGAIAYSDKKILWVGKSSEVPKKFLNRKTSRIRNLKHKSCVIPGLVDCHTHLIFAGNRSNEFALRCAGASYEEIAARGGGILATVTATRQADIRELEALASDRLKEMIRFGVRTIEIKSGYGLDLKSELKMLETVKRLQKKFPSLTLVPTFMGAHAFPKDIPREEYLRELKERMIPEISKKKLAKACDVFIDRGYFTPEEGRAILACAKKAGWAVKIHADELSNTESASLAASLGALSADHLLQISDRGIRELASSQTVAVILPGTAFYLKAPYAPARKLLEAGAKVALSTDFNPGSSMCLSLPAIMTLAALYMGMSRAEIFSAVTYNAACALGLQDRKGTLEKGLEANVVVLPFQKFEEIYYRFAWAGI